MKARPIVVFSLKRDYATLETFLLDGKVQFHFHPSRGENTLGEYDQEAITKLQRIVDLLDPILTWDDLVDAIPGLDTVLFQNVRQRIREVLVVL